MDICGAVFLRSFVQRLHLPCLPLLHGHYPASALLRRLCHLSGTVLRTTLLGSWVRRFLLEHLVAERNLARNTQRSYRDTLALLIPFVAMKSAKVVDRLTVIDLSADLVRLFLADLEESRQCVIATRNQRLASIHALARFVGEHSPEHISQHDQCLRGDRSGDEGKSSGKVPSYRRSKNNNALASGPSTDGILPLSVAVLLCGVEFIQ